LIFLILLVGYYRRKRALDFFGQSTSFERPFLLLLLALFLVIGKQEPTTVEGITQKKATASATLFILDNSLSMTVRDTVQGTSRIQVAKQILDLLLKSQEGNWVALATLDGDFQLLAPLTIDIPITRLMANDAPLGFTGTDFLRSFQTFYQHFQGEHQPSEIVLISDGEPVPPMDVAQHELLMKELKVIDIPLHTVGVGSTQGGIIPDIGKQSTPDFKLLAEMAESTGGNFYRVADAGIIELASTIEDQFIGQKTEGHMQRVILRLSPYFYMLAGLFLLLALKLNPR